MRTSVLLLNCIVGVFFSTRIDAASTLEIHEEQNPATDKYSTYAESNTLNSVNQNNGKVSSIESAKFERIATKHVVRPHILPLPINNYTPLGRRLRFGANNPPVDGISANSIASKGQSSSDRTGEEKTSHNSDDVWERLRLGLKIFWPSLMAAQSKSTLEQEKLVDTSHSIDSHSINSESRKSLNSTARENAVREQQLAASKYIIRPHTAAAPLHRYTALGCRLRFGAGNSSIATDCDPSITTQSRQDSTQEAKNDCLDRIEAPDYQFQHISRSSHDKQNMTGSLAQTTNHSSPCSNRQPLPLTDADMRMKQSNAIKNEDAKQALIDERINRQIHFYSQNPRYLYRVTERARPYLYYIVEQLNQHHLPLELALLPIVESAYQPTAMSSKGAVGLWQFIPGTGKDYDLNQNDQYDERLDVLASTRAAVRYLFDLNVHFKGDWLLALAAYNCGQGAVDNAIKRNLAEGLQADYWSLRLPEETRNYVPRFLALSYIFANPANYGLKFAPVKNQPSSIKVSLDRETDEKILSN